MIILPQFIFRKIDPHYDLFTFLLVKLWLSYFFALTDYFLQFGWSTWIKFETTNHLKIQNMKKKIKKMMFKISVGLSQA